MEWLIEQLVFIYRKSLFVHSIVNQAHLSVLPRGKAGDLGSMGKMPLRISLIGGMYTNCIDLDPLDSLFDWKIYSLQFYEWFKIAAK